MKARYLDKLLGNPGYIVHNCDEYIAVGSPLCHNLITVNKETLELKYALDTFHEGRKSIRSDKLELIWDTLSRLIENGEMAHIIEEDDKIENPITIYQVWDGGIIEHQFPASETLEWPKTTKNGTLIYNNTFFKNREQAVEKAKIECEAAIIMYSERIEEEKKRIKEFEGILHSYRLKKQSLWM